MAKWELALAIKDEEDLPSGHKRKKEGDLIAVKPHPWTWGKMETNEHIIAIVETDLSEKEIVELCLPHYDEIEQIDDYKVKKKTVNKRKFNIPLDIIKDGWCPDLDVSKVRDPKDHYQPLKENNIVMDMSEKVSIVFDKGKGSFKYSRKKIKD